MKIENKIKLINEKEFLVASDVSKSKLDMLSELDLADGHYQCFTQSCKNMITEIKKLLLEYDEIRKAHGFSHLTLVCEPSGGYEKKLMRTARQMGFKTLYVNPEAVNKAQVIENNDNDKSDEKDPGTILRLAKMDRVLNYRNLTGNYLLLRKYNLYYERLESDLISIKNRIHDTLKELFCDHEFKKDFLFGPSGQKLAEALGFNPYRIVKMGEKRMKNKLKSKGIHTKTINRLWSYSVQSAQLILEPCFVEMLEEELRSYFEALKTTTLRIDKVKAKMSLLLEDLIEQNEIRIQPVKGIISIFRLSCIIAETGPLDNFQSIEQLYKYAGLKIKKRESGTYMGQRKISKKGRPILRKNLQVTVLRLVKKEALYGDYYHRKKDAGMPGQKAMTAVSRKFLKMIFGLHRSDQDFDIKRVQSCESQMKKAA